MAAAYRMDQSIKLESIVSKMPLKDRSTCRNMLKSVWSFVIIDAHDRVIYPCKGWVIGSNIVHLLSCILDGDWSRAEDSALFASLLIRSAHASSS
jgi:hypothetical protein